MIWAKETEDGREVKGLHSFGTAAPIAKVTCSFQTPSGEKPWNGRTVALEKVASDITSLACSSTGLTIKFKDGDCFETAQKNWNWVNEDAERYLAMVVNSPSCGNQRKVYNVESYKSDKEGLSMTLTGKAVDYVRAFPYVQFHLSTSRFTNGNATAPSTVSPPYPIANSTQTPQNITSSHPNGNTTAPLPPLTNSTSPTCNITKSASNLSIPLAQDFSGEELFTPNLTSVTDKIDVSLKCSTCKTEGFLDIEFIATSDASQLFDDLDITDAVTASMIITPINLSATIGLDLLINSALTKEFSTGLTVLNVPLIPNPVPVAGIANIGPRLLVNMDFSLGKVEAEADISLGEVTMKIDDCSRATLDFFGSDDAFDGFTPSFSAVGPKPNSASISATAGIAPNIILGVDATALGRGVAAGLALAAPKLDAKLVAGVQSEGACTGVDFTTDLAAELNAFAGIGKINEVAAEDTVEILAASTRIFSSCVTVPVPGATA
ncbi:hypothetical protein CC80DRAFT_548723 [Byssothecium circinans]|uniref:Ricin B lectin domain-containing protein n=1 Tax=Byssothecium circinans TaxID=147558 RepID=A0A6A5TXR3_9PLEO|nr:hypothetical protein CC80DRAFT_548723 [Byssothecium circinans]